MAGLLVPVRQLSSPKRSLWLGSVFDPQGGDSSNHLSGVREGADLQET